MKQPKLLYTNIFYELYYFIKKPNFNKIKPVNKLIFKLLKQFLVFDFITTIMGGLVVGFLIFFFNGIKEVYSSVTFLQRTNIDKFIFLGFLAPMIEELSFRIGLKINRTNIAICFAFQLVLIMRLCKIIHLELWLRLILVFFLFILIYKLLQTKHLVFLKKNYKLFLYYNIIAFGLIHATNYTFLNFSQYFYIPFLVLFPTIFGIYLSFIRIRYHFVIAVFFHCLHNIILLALGVLLNN